MENLRIEKFRETPLKAPEVDCLINQVEIKSLKDVVLGEISNFLKSVLLTVSHISIFVRDAS